MKNKLLVCSIALIVGALSAMQLSAQVPCQAGFTSSVNNNVVTFTNTSTGGNTPSYSWNFGDGNYGWQTNPVHTYLYNGGYSVCLTMWDSLGNCQSTFCDTLVITNAPPPPPPSCQVGFSFTMNNNVVTFTNTSTGGNIPSYFWNFGDGNYSAAANPVHTYMYSGAYNICLTMTDSSNCLSSFCDSVLIANAPNPPNPPCAVNLFLYPDSTNSLLWYAYPTVTGAAPFSYFWDFGDGNNSTLQYPTHTYATVGNYLICLTITDAVGCTTTSCDSTYKLSATGAIQYLVVVNTTPTGIEENAVSVNSIFPNPANDVLAVSLSQIVEGEIKITDIIGREVYGEKINSNNVIVNVSNLPIGYYNFSIVSVAKTIHSKIMIAR